MIPERWQQVKDVLHEALQIPAGQRAAFLDSTCNGDQMLRQEIESLLLEESADTEGSLGSLDLSLERVRHGNASWVGRRIGSYEIIEIIGEGGMGSVYRAARADEQYQKQVAIKIVKLGLGTPFALARFRAERQILANLEHPNIARLLDGGTTENGLPYVVIELIEGQPIDEYCNKHKLSFEERLRLFRTVCLAVQYAHQHLVVHRDLKPGNILVTTEGTPKLLDFGIAKILDTGSIPGGTETTIGFMHMLTPEYASPEQMRSDTVTTASDVYSLGVILYRLLTGRHPYSLDRRSPELMMKTICETEPVKPSEAIQRPEATAGKEAVAGGDVVADGPGDKLRKRLRGDLDNVVLMALRKDAHRRYSSAGQFAEDIQRHLESLPVIARKDTARYRASKFVARHKVGVVAVIAILLTLASGLAVTLREARIARQQTEIARQQRAQAEERFKDLRQVANSFMFEFHDSIKHLAGATPVRALLVRRSREYLDRLARDANGDPSLQQELATAYMKLGDIQGNPAEADLGDANDAMVSYQNALAILQPLLASHPNERVLQLQAAALDERIALHSSAQVCVDLLDRAIYIREALLAHDPADVQLRRDLASSYAELSLHYANPYTISYLLGSATGMRYARKSLDLRQPLLDAAPNDAISLFDVFESYHYIADMLWVTGHPREALHYQMSIRDRMRAFIDHNPTNSEARRLLVTGEGRIASILEELGELSRAWEVLQPAYRGILAIGAADTKNVQIQRQEISGYNEVGELALKMGKFQEAIRNHRQAVAFSLSLIKIDPTNSDSQYRLANSYQALGNALAVRGNLKEAEENSRKGAEIRQSLVLADTSDARGHYALAKNLLDLGNIQARGNPDHALQSYKDGIAILAPMVAADPDDWLMERTLADLYSAAGLATRQFAGSADVEQITGLRRQACSFFLEDATLWQDMGQRNVLIEVDRPKFEAAARRQRECGASRGGRQPEIGKKPGDCHFTDIGQGHTEGC
jgi:non-specific serine/threonine protein kinase/serine/threonine-protein kinase